MKLTLRSREARIQALIRLAKAKPAGTAHKAS
jgi:hypothetical protein